MFRFNSFDQATLFLFFFLRLRYVMTSSENLVELLLIKSKLPKEVEKLKETVDKNLKRHPGTQKKFATYSVDFWFLCDI